MASDQHSPPSKFRIGDRVRVNYVRYPSFWANEALGTVLRHPGSGDSPGIFRMVPTVRGPEPYYWIELDEPRIDDDGDGPYESAEFAAAWLELVSDDS